MSQLRLISCSDHSELRSSSDRKVRIVLHVVLTQGGNVVLTEWRIASPKCCTRCTEMLTIEGKGIFLEIWRNTLDIKIRDRWLMMEIKTTNFLTEIRIVLSEQNMRMPKWINFTGNTNSFIRRMMIECKCDKSHIFFFHCLHFFWQHSFPMDQEVADIVKIMWFCNRITCLHCLFQLLCGRKNPQLCSWFG